MSEELYRSSDMEALLSDLTAAMLALAPTEPHIVNEIGDREKARSGAPPKIVWTPARDKYSAPDVQPKGAHAIVRADESFEVLIWGEDYARAKALRNRLAGGLEKLCTRLSSTMVGGLWSFAGLDSTGAALDMVVTLHFLITDTEYVAIAPATTTVGGIVRDARGLNPEAV